MRALEDHLCELVHRFVEILRGRQFVQDGPVDVGRADRDEIPCNVVLVLFDKVPCGWRKREQYFFSFVF